MSFEEIFTKINDLSKSIDVVESSYQLPLNRSNIFKRNFEEAAIKSSGRTFNEEQILPIIVTNEMRESIQIFKSAAIKKEKYLEKKNSRKKFSTNQKHSDSLQQTADDHNDVSTDEETSNSFAYNQSTQELLKQATNDENNNLRLAETMNDVTHARKPSLNKQSSDKVDLSATYDTNELTSLLSATMADGNVTDHDITMTKEEITSEEPEEATKKSLIQSVDEITVNSNAGASGVIVAAAADDEKEKNFEIDDKNPTPEDVQDTNPTPENVEDTNPTPEDVQDTNPAPEDVQDTNPTPEDVQDTNPAPEDVQDTNPALEDVEDTNPAPEDVQDTNPAPQDVEDTNPAAEDVEDTNPTLEDVQDTNPALEDVQDTNPAPEDVRNMNPTPEDVEDTNPTPEDVEDTNPAAEDVEDTNPAAEDVQDTNSCPEDVQDMNPAAEDVEDTNPTLEDVQEIHLTLKDTSSKDEELVIDFKTQIVSSPNEDEKKLFEYDQQVCLNSQLIGHSRQVVQIEDNKLQSPDMCETFKVNFSKSKQEKNYSQNEIENQLDRFEKEDVTTNHNQANYCDYRPLPTWQDYHDDSNMTSNGYFTPTSSERFYTLTKGARPLPRLPSPLTNGDLYESIDSFAASCSCYNDEKLRSSNMFETTTSVDTEQLLLDLQKKQQTEMEELQRLHLEQFKQFKKDLESKTPWPSLRLSLSSVADKVDDNNLVWNKFSALVKGHLTRKLLYSKPTTMLMQCIRDTSRTLLSLQEDKPKNKEDQIFVERLYTQVRSALYDFHDIFFKTTIKEKMEIIRNSYHYEVKENISPKVVIPKLSKATQRSLERKKIKRMVKPSASCSSISSRITPTPSSSNSFKGVKSKISHMWKNNSKPKKNRPNDVLSTRRANL